MSDKAALQSWIGALSAVKILQDKPEAILPSQIADYAALHPDRVALQGEHDTLTYRTFAARINAYSKWATQLGLNPGDSVCLLMQNCAEYPAIWLGLAQLGCVTALINTSLKSQGLLHCISIARAAHIIVSAEYAESIASIQMLLPEGVKVWLSGDASAHHASFAPLQIENNDTERSAENARYKPTHRDTALLIYTSGTTGLPKAAKVNHGRLMEWSYWFCGMMGVAAQDRMYNCLPMYHSTGGVIAVCAMLVGGGAVVIRQRFSASRFWDDVVEQQCTIFMYIGELCRYLAASPPGPRERAHQLRLACGNGMQKDVWRAVEQRFALKRIIEFYAATEGNVSLYNCEGRPGAIGRVPKFLAHRFPIALIRHDPESGEPLRGEGGFCFECDVDEAGEAIGEIKHGHVMPARGFDGYTNAEASSRKTASDVFIKGDLWFRTGDLMRRDAEGYYYFVDRLGDTFRWKGENVSTTEVAAIINLCPGVTQATVYGVLVPGCEGRAGMAALLVDEQAFSITALMEHCVAHLPSFAVPVFFRLTSSFENTGTFKIQKHNMQIEGYAPDNGDAIWYFMQQEHELIPLTDRIRDALRTGFMP